MLILVGAYSLAIFIKLAVSLSWQPADDVSEANAAEQCVCWDAELLTDAQVLQMMSSVVTIETSSGRR